jgi:hypothetical protein
VRDLLVVDLNLVPLVKVQKLIWTDDELRNSTEKWVLGKVLSRAALQERQKFQPSRCQQMAEIQNKKDCLSPPTFRFEDCENSLLQTCSMITQLEHHTHTNTWKVKAEERNEPTIMGTTLYQTNVQLASVRCKFNTDPALERLSSRVCPAVLRQRRVVREGFVAVLMRANERLLAGVDSAKDQMNEP